MKFTYSSRIAPQKAHKQCLLKPKSVTLFRFSQNIKLQTIYRHGNQFSKIINSEMVILTPITINNDFNNANYVTKVDHLCSERHTFNFLLKKVDFRDLSL